MNSGDAAAEDYHTLHELLCIARAPHSVTVRDPGPDDSTLEAAPAAGKTVYGYSTGYGALASFASGAPERHQENLIAHLATGTGPPFDASVARAMLFDRLVTLSKGKSAASAELIHFLVEVLAGPHAPSIPAYGSVGASGDLTPLAHLALALSGRGEWLEREPLRDGQVVSAPPADTRWTFDRRDALALVNGTGASLALLALSWWEIAALLPVALESMAHMVSAMGLARTAYADQLQRARIHPGQAAAAEAMRIASAREPAGRVEASAARSKASDGGLLRHEQAIQSAYSFRAIPQVLGPCLEALWDVYQVAERELNAVTDNPIFEPPDQVFHGANFHGHVVAHAADRLALVAADIAQLLDRQLARITDPMLNHGLPPFLTGDEVGASSGFMGAQVTATALAAELSASAQRRYVLESRSTNGANQDIVSMSTLAALSLYNAVPRLQEMVAVHAMCAIQAVELASTDAGRTTGTRGAKTSLAHWVRSQSAFLSKDRPLSGDIMRIAAGLSAITGTRSAPYREAAAMKPAAEGEGGMERGSPPESAAVTVLGPPLDLWATLYGGITPRPDHDWVG